MNNGGKRTFGFKTGGKDVDYRQGEELDLNTISSFFTEKDTGLLKFGLPNGMS